MLPCPFPTTITITPQAVSYLQHTFCRVFTYLTVNSILINIQLLSIFVNYSLCTSFCLFLIFLFINKKSEVKKTFPSFILSITLSDIISLGKVCIQLFSTQWWINSRAVVKLDTHQPFCSIFVNNVIQIYFKSDDHYNRLQGWKLRKSFAKIIFYNIFKNWFVFTNKTTIQWYKYCWDICTAKMQKDWR